MTVILTFVSMSAVGQDLLDVPFPEMLTKLALAIAEAQRHLDRASIETAKALANDKVKTTTEIKETLDASGKVVKSEQFQEEMSLLEWGINPTFYQFVESTLEVKIAISMKKTSEQSASPVYAKGWGPFATPITGKYTQSFSYQVDGASLIRAVLKPVPPPVRIQPRITVAS